jgi:hypothetical protein
MNPPSRARWSTHRARKPRRCAPCPSSRMRSLPARPSKPTARDEKAPSWGPVATRLACATTSCALKTRRRAQGSFASAQTPPAGACAPSLRAFTPPQPPRCPSLAVGCLSARTWFQSNPPLCPPVAVGDLSARARLQSNPPSCPSLAGRTHCSPPSCSCEAGWSQCGPPSCSCEAVRTVPSRNWSQCDPPSCSSVAVHTDPGHVESSTRHAQSTSRRGQSNPSLLLEVPLRDR